MLHLPLPSAGLGPLVTVPTGRFGPDLPPALLRVALKQHCAVTHAQVLANGMSEHSIRWRLSVGEWQHVHHGVYCTYAGPLAPGTILSAALLAAGDGAVLDGRTALSLYGVKGYESELVHLRVPHRRHPDPIAGAIVRRTRNLPPRAVIARRGLPTIRLERAALAVAPSSIGVLTAVVQQRFTTAEKLRGYLLGMGPVKGRAGMLRALRDIEGGSRSELEREFQGIVDEYGLPQPQRNFQVVLAGGRVVYLDNAWTEPGQYCAEIDGKSCHFLAEDWESDLERQNALVVARWIPLRFTATALRRRAEVAATVRAVLLP